MSKRCCRCKIEKPATEFWPSQRRCKDCCRSYRQNPESRAKRNAASRRWYAENRERALADAQRWRAQNHEKYRATYLKYWKSRTGYRRNYNLKRAYGITLEQYDSMLAAQNERCGCCGTHTPGHKGKFVVDHCHLSGKVRGLLCNNCNQALGLMRDSIGYGLSLVAYLAKTGGVEHYAGCQPYIYESAKEILDALAKNNWRRPEIQKEGEPAWN